MDPLLLMTSKYPEVLGKVTPTSEVPTHLRELRPNRIIGGICPSRSLTVIGISAESTLTVTTGGQFTELMSLESIRPTLY